MPVPLAARAGAQWMTVTLGMSTYTNTAFLRAGGTSTGHTIARVLGASVFGTSIKLFERHAADIFGQLHTHAPLFAIPAIALFLSNYFNSIALARCGITVTYVTKSASPVATILLCVLGGWGALPPARALLAVPVVVLGVAMSVWSNAEFDRLGFAAACASTICQSLTGITGRAAMLSSGLNGEEAHWLMCCLLVAGLGGAKGVSTLAQGAAAVVTGRSSPRLRASTALGAKDERRPLPTIKLGSLARAIRLRRQPVQLPPVGSADTPTIGHAPPASPHPRVRRELLRILTAASYHMEYSLMFTFSALVDSVTLAVSDTVRRSGIVYVGRLMFGGSRLVPINIIGVVTALLGALLYSALARH